ncbi:MAG: DUF1990 family protein [Stellaceae bacterium]
MNSKPSDRRFPILAAVTCMQLSLSDRGDTLAALIPGYRDRPLSYETPSFPERTTIRAIAPVDAQQDLGEYDLGFFFRYDIFPPTIMRFAGEWIAERRAMRVGDIIVQQVFLPPYPAASLKMIFGVRILNISSAPDRVAFSYGTLVGHAETGESEFAVRRQGAELQAVIRTRSRPASWLARVMGPIAALPYQAYCTRRALDHLVMGVSRVNPRVRMASAGRLSRA